MCKAKNNIQEQGHWENRGELNLTSKARVSDRESPGLWYVKPNYLVQKARVLSTESPSHWYRKPESLVQKPWVSGTESPSFWYREPESLVQKAQVFGTEGLSACTGELNILPSVTVHHTCVILYIIYTYILQQLHARNQTQCCSQSPYSVLQNGHFCWPSEGRYIPSNLWLSIASDCDSAIAIPKKIIQ